MSRDRVDRVAGHYENLGVVPLLRRKCTRICAVDCAPGRDLTDVKHMINLAEGDCGSKIWLGSSEFNETILQPGLNDFYLPRSSKADAQLHSACLDVLLHCVTNSNDVLALQQQMHQL